MQVGIVNRTTDPLQGVDRDMRILVGAYDSSVNGMQLGVVNLADAMTGIQFGLVNRSRVVRWLQIELLNIADQLQGIQIVALNIIKSGPVLFPPMVNAHF